MMIKKIEYQHSLNVLINLIYNTHPQTNFKCHRHQFPSIPSKVFEQEPSQAVHVSVLTDPTSGWHRSLVIKLNKETIQKYNDLLEGIPYIHQSCIIGTGPSGDFCLLSEDEKTLELHHFNNSSEDAKKAIARRGYAIFLGLPLHSEKSDQLRFINELQRVINFCEKLV